ncbi:MAG: ABC transporter substrate-binding protein [bacterium]|nr:ABC transporter substrate-binding protein [bacterium]
MLKKVFMLFLILTCSASAASLPRYGGTLKIGVGSMPQSLDPAKAVSPYEKEVCSKIYNTLPEVAKSYNSLKDGLSWVFNILPGIQFQNSRILTAYDVKYSFERAANPKTNSPYSYIFNAVQGVDEYRSGSAGEIAGIRVLDQNILEINLRYLDNSFFQDLSLCAASILPVENLNEAGDEFWDAPVGSGPFRFVSSDEKEIILEANEEYFEGRPYLNDIRFSIFPEENTKSSESLVLNRLTTVFLGINHQNKLFEKPYLREAAGLSIDRQKIMDTVSASFEISNRGIAPDILELSKKDLILNQEEAKAILNHEEYSTVKNELVTLYVPDGSPELEKIGSEIRNELAAAGFNIQMELKPKESFLQALSENKPGLFLSAFTIENKEPKNFYAYLFNQFLPYTYYSSEKITNFLHLAEQSVDKNEAVKSYEEIENIMLDEKPFIFLGFLPYTIYYEPKLLDLETDFNKLKINSSWIMPR